MPTVIMLVIAPPVPCVGVTWSGHRILDWELWECDEYTLALADIQDVGMCPYSYKLKSIFIDGVWHATDALPFRDA